MPIELSQSMPNPDLVIARGTIRDYLVNHPTAEDILLLVEIDNSTLTFDLQNKAKIYAANGITDYWVLDIVHSKLHVFRQPKEDCYGQIEELDSTKEIVPLNFPNIVFKVLKVAQMLP